jgi:hypothetical protein
MALSFSSIADKKIDEIERPPLPPVGTYRWKVTKLPELSKSNDEKWEILTVSVRAVEALDDVDMSDYSGKLEGIMQSVRFMFNLEDEAEFEKTLFRVRTFFEKHVKCAEAGMTIPQAINASVGQEFLGTIAWKQDKQDADIFHANIGKTAPLE